MPSEGLRTRISQGLDWQFLRYGLVALLLIFAAVSVRLLEWPAWATGPFWLGDDPILAANDAYAWLAGAEGEGRMQGWPMARLLAGLDWALPWSSAQIAFFLPVFLAPLPALFLLLLTHRRGHLPAALTAGVACVAGLGFLLRTRLGFADTELFALPAVLGLGVFLMLAMDLKKEHAPAIGWRWLLAACVWASLGVWAYPSAFPLLVAISVTAVFAWRMAGGRPLAMHCAAFAMLASLHFEVTGLILAIGFCWLGARDALTARPWLLALIASLLVLAVVQSGHDAWEGVWRRLLAYLGHQPRELEWLLPGVSASIWETTPESLGDYARRLAGHWIFVLAGLVGYLYLVMRRGEWLVFAPLLLLGLAGFWLGPRFALYATPVIGIGLGFGLAELLKQRQVTWRWHWPAQAMLAVSLLGTTLWLARDFSPQPALTVQHARALQVLNKQLGNASDGAGHRWVWEWWGLGYAAQYYAGRPSFADGGSTSRRHALMLGKVMGATTPAEAAAWMRYAAFERGGASAYGYRPLVSLEGLSASEAEAALESRVQRMSERPRIGGEAYLVVSWHALRRAEWISQFARWGLVSGNGGHGESMTLQPPVQLDEPTGVLSTNQGPVSLSTLTILEGGQSFQRQWRQTGDGIHAVINNDLGEGVLLDDALFRMMVVQMLIAPPEQFDQEFELVVDETPATRVYRVF